MTDIHARIVEILDKNLNTMSLGDLAALILAAVADHPEKAEGSEPDAEPLPAKLRRMADAVRHINEDVAYAPPRGRPDSSRRVRPLHLAYRANADLLLPWVRALDSVVQRRRRHARALRWMLVRRDSGARGARGRGRGWLTLFEAPWHGLLEPRGFPCATRAKMCTGEALLTPMSMAGAPLPAASVLTFGRLAAPTVRKAPR